MPEGAAVLGDSVRQMTIAEAKAILTGGDTAATDYFRRTSSTALEERMQLIVQSATEKVGVTSAYKGMASKAGGVLGNVGSGALANLGGLGNFGGLGEVAGNMLGGDMSDIDACITDKALDGLFLKIAGQEKLIRADRVARATDLLKQVFGSLGR